MMEQVTALLLPPASVGVVLAGLLTLIVFSYLIGDNPLYRVAQHLLVGTALGYAVVVAFHQVMLRRLAMPLAESPEANWPLIVPTVVGLLLFARVNRRVGWLANLAIAPVIGVGAALALTGALVGSFLPQIEATAIPLWAGPDSTGGVGELVGRLVLVVGVVCTLSYFYLTVRRTGPAGIAARWAGVGGKWVMMVAFGALFASLAIGRVSLLVGRVHFLLGDWLGLIGR